MPVFVSLCMYVSVSLCASTCVCVCVCICVYICVCLCVCLCMSLCVYVCVHMPQCGCTGQRTACCWVLGIELKYSSIELRFHYQMNHLSSPQKFFSISHSQSVLRNCLLVVDFPWVNTEVVIPLSKKNLNYWQKGKIAATLMLKLFWAQQSAMFRIKDSEARPTSHCCENLDPTGS